MALASSIEEIKFLVGYQITTYVYVSSATLLISDWFSTLDIEIAHAWGAPCNLGTILFFLTRYLVFIDTFVALYRQLTHSIPPSTCTVLYIFGGLFIGFEMIVAELILTIRVWALWDRRRDIKIFLIVVSIVNASVGLTGYAFYGFSLKFANNSGNLPPSPWCFPESGGKTLQWTFLALLVHQTLIFVMTIIKAIQHYREGAYKTSLTYTFYRDGLSYYTVVIVLSVINMAVLFSRPSLAYENLVTPIQRVLHSILSSRMLLHLRQEADTLQSIGQDFNTVPTLYFDSDIDCKRCSELSFTPEFSLKDLSDDDMHKSTIASSWFGQDETSSHQRQWDPEA